MRPVLVLLGGGAGVGKSTLCGELRRTGGVVVLGKDEVTREVCEELLVALGRPRNDRESGVYLARVRPVEYRLLETVALACLSAGQRVVAEAPWLIELSDPRWVRGMRRRVERAGGTLMTAWLTCAPGENRRRLVARAAGRDEGKLADWAAYMEQGPGRFVSVAPDHVDVVLDTTTRSPADLARQLLLDAAITCR